MSVKYIVELVVGFAGGMYASAALPNPNLGNPLLNGVAMLGKLAIGGYAGVKASEYAVQLYDEIEDLLR